MKERTKFICRMNNDWIPVAEAHQSWTRKINNLTKLERQRKKEKKYMVKHKTAIEK